MLWKGSSPSLGATPTVTLALPATTPADKPMDTENDQLVNEAECFHRREEETKRHVADLKHRRWTAFGAFFKKTLFTLALLAGGGVLYMGGRALFRDISKKQDVQEKQARFEKEQRQQAWVECVNVLGLNTCKRIAESQFVPCLDAEWDKIECLEAKILPHSGEDQ